MIEQVLVMALAAFAVVLVLQRGSIFKRWRENPEWKVLNCTLCLSFWVAIFTPAINRYFSFLVEGLAIYGLVMLCFGLYNTRDKKCMELLRETREVLGEVYEQISGTRQG